MSVHGRFHLGRILVFCGPRTFSLNGIQIFCFCRRLCVHVIGWNNTTMQNIQQKKEKGDSVREECSAFLWKLKLSV